MLASIHHTVTWRYPAKKQKLHCSKPLHLHGACHLRPSKWSVPSLTSTVLSPHKASFSLFQRANNLFTSKHSKPGLFGVDGLHSAHDWDLITEVAVQRCDTLVSQLAPDLLAQLSATEIVDILDEISETVCSVSDPGELCRNVHPKAEWRDKANNAVATIGTYIHNLNTNTNLHAATAKLLQNKQDLSEEALMVVHLLNKEFELNGIFLESSQRREVVKLQSQISLLESTFMANLYQQQQQHTLGLQVPFSMVQELPDSVKSTLEIVSHSSSRPSQSPKAQPSQTLDVILREHHEDSILKYVPNSRIRKAVYIMANQGIPANEKVLSELLLARHKLANLISFPSFADLTLSNNRLLRRPYEVEQFLVEVSHGLRSKAAQELAILRAEKKHHLTNSTVNDTGEDIADGADIQVFAWDKSFYATLVKKNYLRSNNSPEVSRVPPHTTEHYQPSHQPHGTNSENDEQAFAIQEYLTLDNALEGLNIVLQDLFDITLQQVSLDKGEGWHSSVMKFALIQKQQQQQPPEVQEELLGFIYMDLFPRENKFNHAATFAIQFPKVASRVESSSSAIMSSQLLSAGSTSTRLAKGLTRLPRVALVCNFAHRPVTVPHEDGNHSPETVLPLAKSTTIVGGKSKTLKLLSHSELETLFHEFGHCLASLLSRTRYQHVAGTRCALDFVETPSTLMEHFVWDYRVLSRFAKHFRTKEPLPPVLLDNCKASKKMFAALDTQLQVCYSLFDQIIHGPQPPSNQESSSALQPTMTTASDVLARLQNEHSFIPFVHGTHWETKFGHIVGYGAGYYSYLYSRLFSSNFWYQCFAADPLNRSTGERYRREILAHGGAKHPMQMVDAMLQGQPLQTQYLLKDICD